MLEIEIYNYVGSFREIQTNSHSPHTINFNKVYSSGVCMSSQSIWSITEVGIIIVIFREEIEEEEQKKELDKYRKGWDKPPIAALINLGKGTIVVFFE